MHTYGLNNINVSFNKLPKSNSSATFILWNDLEDRKGHTAMLTLDSSASIPPQTITIRPLSAKT